VVSDFIDLHIYFDAQIGWEPELSRVSWPISLLRA
jgi:hypothetical protein